AEAEQRELEPGRKRRLDRIAVDEVLVDHRQRGRAAGQRALLGRHDGLVLGPEPHGGSPKEKPPNIAKDRTATSPPPEPAPTRGITFRDRRKLTRREAATFLASAPAAP